MSFFHNYTPLTKEEQKEHLLQAIMDVVALANREGIGIYLWLADNQKEILGNIKELSTPYGPIRVYDDPRS